MVEIIDVFTISTFKVCTKCKESKPLESYHSQSSAKDGRRSACKVCMCAARKIYHEKNIDKDNARSSEYLQKNSDSVKKYYKNWREDNKDYKKQKDTEYYTNNVESIKQQAKNYYLSNTDKVAVMVKKYRTENAEACKACAKNYRQTHKKQRNAYEKHKLATDPIYKLRRILRNRLTDALRGNQKTGSAVRDLGCSVEQLKVHLESLFFDNPKTGEKMSWENHGKIGWEIDHWMPLASYDLSDRKQLLKACNWSNLRPLWGSTNNSKRGILPGNLPESTRQCIPDYFWEVQTA